MLQYDSLIPDCRPISFPAGISARCPNHWGAHTLHLRSFTCGIPAAIRGITHLELTSSVTESKSVESVSLLLSLLAVACPSLHQLQIAGDYKRGMLASFGTSCANLSCLKVLTNISDDTLEALHHIMPHLTHCCCQLPELDDESAFSTFNATSLPDAGPCCLSLLSCTSLTHLDLGCCGLTTEMWYALPLGLRQLRCSLSSNPPARLKTLANLKLFDCYCDDAMEVDLSIVVALLCAAPQLSGLHLSGWGHDAQGEVRGPVRHTCVGVSCPLNDILELFLLHDRILAGLSVSCTLPCGKHFQGVILSFWNIEDSVVEEEELHGQRVSGYLATLPAFPAFTRLEFWCPCSKSSKLPITPTIASVFPNLTFLLVNLDKSFTNDDLVDLGACTSLQHLAFNGARVTPVALAMLCTRLVALKTLRLTSCVGAGIPITDGKELEHVLRAWGSKVEISVV